MRIVMYGIGWTLAENRLQKKKYKRIPQYDEISQLKRIRLIIIRKCRPRVWVVSPHFERFPQTLEDADRKFE